VKRKVAAKKGERERWLGREGKETGSWEEKGKRQVARKRSGK
jgi:hypothetical protein